MAHSGKNTTGSFGQVMRTVSPMSAYRIFGLLLFLALAGPLASAVSAEREFRGAWVATVHNLDWPSAPGLPVETQKAQLRAILNRAAELKLNAILLQVRPMSDALYAS